MPIPDSPRVQYAQNPLKQVIFEVRYPSILSIRTDVPVAFQATLRTQYPGYSTISSFDQIPENLRSAFANAGMPLPPFGSSHEFSTSSGNRNILLSSEKLAITERKYSTWDVFRKEIFDVLECFVELYKPSELSRIGLRYQNAIDRIELGDPSIPWTDLVQQPIAGLLSSAEVGDDLATVQSQATFRLVDSNDAIESFVGLRYGTFKDASTKHDIFVIDSDCYTAAAMEISIQRVMKTLDFFNRQVGNLFRWSITPKLAQLLSKDPTN